MATVILKQPNEDSKKKKYRDLHKFYLYLRIGLGVSLVINLILGYLRYKHL